MDPQHVLTPDATGVMQLRGAYGASDIAHSPTFALTFAMVEVFGRRLGTLSQDSQNAC